MPTLKMYVGNLLLDTMPIDMDGLESIHDKIAFQQRKAEEMFWVNHKELSALQKLGSQPVFYLHLESKMNNSNFQPTEKINS